MKRLLVMGIFYWPAICAMQDDKQLKLYEISTIHQELRSIGEILLQTHQIPDEDPRILLLKLRSDALRTRLTILQGQLTQLVQREIETDATDSD